MASKNKGIKKPTLKTQNALKDYVLHPTDKISAVAERNNVSYDALRRAINAHQDFIKEESNKIWKSKVIMAQRVLEEKAERGDFRCLDFLLRSNGIVPEEKITTGEQDIHITLDSNKDE